MLETDPFIDESFGVCQVLSTHITHPVLAVSGSSLQTLLQQRAQAARPAELVHHAAGVVELLRGQQRLQRPQVTLQRVGQGGHRLRGHGGGEGTLLLPRGRLRGDARRVGTFLQHGEKTDAMKKV